MGDDTVGDQGVEGVVDGVVGVDPGRRAVQLDEVQLVDAEGEVVGIAAAASSDSVIDGCAVPAEDALAVVAQITSGRSTA